MSQRDLKFPDRICLLSPTMGEICLWCIKKRRALSKPAQKKVPVIVRGLNLTSHFVEMTTLTALWIKDL